MRTAGSGRCVCIRRRVSSELRSERRCELLHRVVVAAALGKMRAEVFPRFKAVVLLSLFLPAAHFTHVYSIVLILPQLKMSMFNIQHHPRFFLFFHRFEGVVEVLSLSCL